MKIGQYLLILTNLTPFPGVPVPLSLTLPLRTNNSYVYLHFIMEQKRCFFPLLLLNLADHFAWAVKLTHRITQHKDMGSKGK